MTVLTSNLKMGTHIGSGHFGDVFLANDPVHGEVAVKVIARDATESPEEWQKRKDNLLKEAQHLKKATHRNVVQVYHLGEHKDDAMLCVMEYCSGGSLQKPYDNGPISIDKVLRVATEITSGLQALHSREMLHRDIKPGNLLINSKGVAQLGDFGLVTDNLILGYGSQAGYADHIAPEVWAGNGTSAKTDIWALGMTLYRLLHGRQWYEQGSTPRTVVANGRYADSLVWLPHIPADWRRPIRKMLRDDPVQRHQTATDVFAALSSLPSQPSWLCVVGPTEVRWQRNSKTRKISVVWDISIPKKSKWKAWSEPLGSGINRTLGGSTKPLTRSAALKELTKFFESQT
ncbi:serine/threonine-protein kinase [Methylocapsa acidiphila]|uniref:serine/threonine-protein kinase n=1 Tax=Methylocapsa acidiphila TaxID=133552 RepID=UPI00047ACFA3|nr:serine/threonine-protein kinase [Methylocapsa acidiphila]